MLRSVLPGGFASPRLTLGHLIVMVIVVYMVGFGIAAALGTRPPRLTPQTPLLRLEDGLSVLLVGDAPARVRAETHTDLLTPEATRALPAHLTPDSIGVSVRTAGTVEVVFPMPDPNGIYDVYRWDQRRATWVFVPSTSQPQIAQVRARAHNDPIALFEVGEFPQMLGASTISDELPGAGTLVALNLLLIEDFELGASALPSVQSSTRIMPVLSSQTTAGLLEQRTQAAVSAIEEADLPAVVFDVHGDAEGLHDVVAALDIPTGIRIHSEHVDHSLALAVDYVFVDQPASETGALLMLQQMTGQVERTKVIPVVSAMSSLTWHRSSYALGYEEALSLLGDVTLLPETQPVLRNPEPGEPVGFTLGGSAVDLIHDTSTGELSFTIYAENGEQQVHVMTAGALVERLGTMSEWPTAGIVVAGAFGEDAAPQAAEAVTAFKAGQPISAPPDYQVSWSVSSGGSTVVETTAAVGEPLIWQPEADGAYAVSAELIAGSLVLDKGQQMVEVGGNVVVQVPDFEGVVAGAPDLEGGDQPTPAAVNPNLPPPGVPPSAPGRFELGGQVNHVIYHPAQMKQAGMRWVKFQVAWEDGMSPDVVLPLLAQGEEQNMKVLLSIAGQVKYPDSINFDSYLDFVEGVAYYSPDAIEVWNEGNLAFEWPRGQINGVTYVEEMLAPAYNRIKRVNPNIMVISGALAPTGAFFAEGGCAKDGSGCEDWIYLQQMAQAAAANYMDCVGVHINAGATSPYATEGHPADPGYQHYSWYFGSMVELYGGTFGRPVCFTELGYLSGDGYGAVPARFNWAGNTRVSDQAQWLAEAARYSRELGTVRMLIVWNVDFVYWGDDPMAGYAIVRPDGSCPACSTLGRVMSGEAYE
ncbi:MAG: hypothetical protein ACFB51_20515 [Anaerolineae bacterium]